MTAAKLLYQDELICNGRNNTVAMDVQLIKGVLPDLFAVLKFLESNDDLVFNGIICHYFIKKLQVVECKQYEWWKQNSNAVRKSIDGRHASVSNLIKQSFMGKLCNVGNMKLKLTTNNSPISPIRFMCHRWITEYGWYNEAMQEFAFDENVMQPFLAMCSGEKTMENADSCWKEGEPKLPQYWMKHLFY